MGGDEIGQPIFSNIILLILSVSSPVRDEDEIITSASERMCSFGYNKLLNENQEWAAYTRGFMILQQALKES